MKETKAPVGLEKGDEFVTAWGNLEVIEVDRPDDYLMKDIKTGEEVWFEIEDLVEIMAGSIYSIRD